MKRYIDHLNRELFRYALAVTALLFLLFTAGLMLNLQVSTVGVLSDGAKRLSSYWGESIVEIESGIVELAGAQQIKTGLLGPRPTAAQQADAYAVLYDEVNSWSDGSSFAVVDGTGRIVATNLYRGNEATLIEATAVAAVRAAVSASEDGISRQALPVRLEPPHAGFYVSATKIFDSREHWDGALMIGILGERGVIDQVHAESIERIVVTDEFNNIFLDTSARELQAMGPGSAKFLHSKPSFLTLTANGVDYFHASSFDKATGSTITVLTPQRFFWAFVSTSFLILSVVAVAVVVLAKVMTRRQSRRSAQDLARLDRGIGQWFDGNLDFRLSAPTYQEFTGVFESFNHLIDQLDVQVKNNISLEQSHTALEVRQLETQFNPHFVFNTLEMLRYEITTEPDTARRIVMDLASLMRYSIREHGAPVTLHEDIAYLRSFLELHKLRLGASMTYVVDCAPETLDALVPRLLIQPLVENALAHARPSQQKPLAVQVSAETQDDVLTLTVQDNGAPISDEVLVAIRESLEAEEQPTNHLGVFLVNRVVRLMYGSEFGLRIDADVMGTRAVVRLPYEV